MPRTPQLPAALRAAHYAAHFALYDPKGRCRRERIDLHRRYLRARRNGTWALRRFVMIESLDLTLKASLRVSPLLGLT